MRPHWPRAIGEEGHRRGTSAGDCGTAAAADPRAGLGPRAVGRGDRRPVRRLLVGDQPAPDRAEHAGFLLERRDGNSRLYRADQAALGPLRAVVEEHWRTGLDRIKELAEAEREQRDKDHKDQMRTCRATYWKSACTSRPRPRRCSPTSPTPPGTCCGWAPEADLEPVARRHLPGADARRRRDHRASSSRSTRPAASCSPGAGPRARRSLRAAPGWSSPSSPKRRRHPRRPAPPRPSRHEGNRPTIERAGRCTWVGSHSPQPAGTRTLAPAAETLERTRNRGAQAARKRVISGPEWNVTHSRPRRGRAEGWSMRLRSIPGWVRRALLGDRQ